MLIFFSSPPFYTWYVHLPSDGTPTPPIILNNPKYYPFLKDALGAIDGTHINCSASAEMCQAARDHKGGITQNCLAICGFDMIFYYIFSGWDESAANSTMFYDARMTDLHIPASVAMAQPRFFQKMDTVFQIKLPLFWEYSRVWKGPTAEGMFQH